MQGVATRPPVVHERLAYLDNLKTVLIAGIIAGHAVQGYSDFGDWTYQDVREVSLSPVGEWFGAIVISRLVRARVADRRAHTGRTSALIRRALN